MRLFSLSVIFIVACSGCAGMQDYHFRLTNRMRAKEAYKEIVVDETLLDCKDHHDGWVDGYFDVLTGGKGDCPPVPPHHYWSAAYQTPEGWKAIESYFQGFRDGAAAGHSSRYWNALPLPSAVEPPGINNPIPFPSAVIPLPPVDGQPGDEFIPSPGPMGAVNPNVPKPPVKATGAD